MHDQPTLQTPRSPSQGMPARPAGAGTPIVTQWTGREIRALRLALRMTNEEFAEGLGVAVQTVSKWNTHPGHATVPELQRALDTLLDQAPTPARERFTLALTAGECPAPLPRKAGDTMTDRSNDTDDGRHLSDDNVELSATADDEDLMTRREVGTMFGVVSATVKNWARSNTVALTELKDDQGRPRYRRAEVEALFRSGFRGFESRSVSSRLRKR